MSFSSELSWRARPYRCAAGHEGGVLSLVHTFEATEGPQPGEERVMREGQKPFPLADFRCEQCGGEVEMGEPVEMDPETGEPRASRPGGSPVAT